MLGLTIGGDSSSILHLELLIRNSKERHSSSFQNMKILVIAVANFRI